MTGVPFLKCCFSWNLFTRLASSASGKVRWVQTENLQDSDKVFQSVCANLFSIPRWNKYLQNVVTYKTFQHCLRCPLSQEKKTKWKTRNLSNGDCIWWRQEKNVFPLQLHYSFNRQKSYFSTISRRWMFKKQQQFLLLASKRVASYFVLLNFILGNQAQFPTM